MVVEGFDARREVGWAYSPLVAAATKTNGNACLAGFALRHQRPHGREGQDMELTLPSALPPREDPSALWSVQLHLLRLAEDTLGPRDASKTICQPVFTDHGPNIRNTQNLDGTFAELSRKAEPYWPTLINELAHETVHLLNPKPGDGTWLSEGIAVAFSNYTQQQFELEPQTITMASYKRSLELVSELPPDALAAGRRIRKACSLDNATQSILETLFPGVDLDTLTELCKPFERDWSDPATP